MTTNEVRAALDAPAPANQLRPLAAILEDLKKPPAPKHLRTKKKGGTELTFIPWYFVIQYLDLYAPGWCYEIRSVTEIKGHSLRAPTLAEIKGGADPKQLREEIKSQVVLTVRITIPTADGFVWREASGIEDDETNSYGDTSSNAESMALRRAAAKLGFGLYLYDATKR